MEPKTIIKVITDIFEGADERNWEKVRRSMADEVLLDYSSMNGSPAAVISSKIIIEAWKAFLPGFDRTHHQLSDFNIDEQTDVSNAHFLGKADHYIDKDSWTVEGSYEIELIRSGESWEVTKFKFNLQNQTGNMALPQKATELAKSG